MGHKHVADAEKGNGTGMNPEIKDEWISALESGEYPHESTYLHTAQGYCVLGVLGDIAVRYDRAAWEPWSPCALTANGGLEGFNLLASDGKEAGRLPESVRDWAGLSEYQETDLWEMNDDGATFPELAIWIKENL